MEKAPVLDGTIGEEEWRCATAVSGVSDCFMNALQPRPATFYLGWDADHLYLAARVWLPADYKPRVRGRSPRLASIGDEGLEFNFHPMGKNLPKGVPDQSFKIFVNALGYMGDPMRLSVGQQMKNWLPDFNVAFAKTADGTAPLGGCWYEWEIAATTADFELAGPNRVGDAWHIMLGVNGMPQGFRQARIPSNSGYFEPQGHVDVVLAENIPCVQEIMEEIPGPVMDGLAKVRFNIYNPTATPVTVDLLCNYAKARPKVEKEDGKEIVTVEETPVVTEEKTLEVAPGETAAYRVDRVLPRDVPNDRYGIYYRVKAGDKTLFQYYTFFMLGDQPSDNDYTKRHGYRDVRHVLTKDRTRTQEFQCSLAFFPTRAMVRIEADAYYLDHPDDVAGMTYTVRRQDDAALLAEGGTPKAVFDIFADSVRLPELTPGTYVAEVSLRLKDGAILGPVQKTFEKLDEKKEFAAWWEKGLGDTERIIPPFTSIEQEDNVVSVWGRTYTLDALGLPRSIVSRNGAVMACPARVVAVKNGRERAISLTGQLTITESKDWRVRFRGAAEGAGLIFESNGWIEQDGLVYVELTYRPKGGAPVELDALAIEYPLAPETAECLTCIGPGGNYAAKTSIVLPGEGEGRLWSTLDTGIAGSVMTVGSFYPQVWLGNDRRGLLWWADNDKGWVPDNDVPAHVVERRDGAVVLRNNIIGTPYTLAAPRTLALSYMASPFRPLPKGWRQTIGSRDGTFGTEFKFREDPETGQTLGGQNMLTPAYRDPARWPADWAECKAKADAWFDRFHPFDIHRARYHDYVHNSQTLFGYGPKSLETKPYRYFGWHGEFDDHVYTDVYQDYILYLIDRAITEGGLRTLYYDITFPWCGYVPEVGGGYALDDGRPQKGYFGWNVRRYMMRLQSLMHDHGLTPGAVNCHSTNGYFLVVYPWVDSLLDGEFHWVEESSDFDWVDGWPVDRMRSMSSGHNYGLVITWMNLIRVTDRNKRMELYGELNDYIRLYDSWRTHDWQLMNEDMLDWGMNDEDVDYIPFWRNPYAACEDEDILVSLWRLPARHDTGAYGRFMLGIFNDNRDQPKRNVEIRLDLEALEFLMPRRMWQDFVRVRPLDQAGWDKRVDEIAYAGNQNCYRGNHPHMQPVLDWKTKTLTIKLLPPHKGRFVGIRSY